MNPAQMPRARERTAMSLTKAHEFRDELRVEIAATEARLARLRQLVAQIEDFLGEGATAPQAVPESPTRGTSFAAPAVAVVASRLAGTTRYDRIAEILRSAGRSLTVGTIVDRLIAGGDG